MPVCWKQPEVNRSRRQNVKQHRLPHQHPSKRHHPVWLRVLGIVTPFGGNLTLFCHVKDTSLPRPRWNARCNPGPPRDARFNSPRSRHRPVGRCSLFHICSDPSPMSSATVGHSPQCYIRERRLMLGLSSPLHHALSLLRWSHPSLISRCKPKR